MDGDGRKDLGLPSPVDLCKLTKYQRQRQKDAYLAKPKAVFSYSTLWAPAKRRAGAHLKTKCSPHTELLAKPKTQLPKIHFKTKAEREAEMEMRAEMTKEELRWLDRKPIPPVDSGVKRSALNGKSTPRLDMIALASLKQLVVNKRLYFDKLPKVQKESIQKYIKDIIEDFRTRYPPESEKMYNIINGAVVHATCMDRGDAAPPGKKLYICELSKAQRRIFRKRMKALSLPAVRPPPSTGPDRGPKKRLIAFEPWLMEISQPRYNVMNEVPFDPFSVKESAKHYVATERIISMAKPRVPPQPPPLVDFEGNELPPRREWSFESRKRIIASPRTIELATPRFVKKKAAEDTKEDPFAVVRRALTAFCSQRTKELAEPKKRA